MKKYTVLLCLFLTAISLQAQNIVSIGTIPALPTPTDTVKIIAHLQFNSGGCEMQSYSSSVSGTIIYISAKHCTGLLTYICDAYDTIPLGVFSSGTYYLQLDAEQWTYDLSGNCTNYLGNVQQLTSFVVIPSTGFASIEKPILSVTWNTQLHQPEITGKFDKALFELTDLAGRSLFNGMVTSGTMELNQLPERTLLLYSLQLSDGTVIRGKLITD